MRIFVGFFLAVVSVVGLPLDASNAAPKPHVLFVLVDDLGWGNVGFHRANATKEVVTPHMDDLVKEGIKLMRHYVHPMCTPTRSALQTGRLPVHVQMTLHGPCNAESGIPTNMTGLATKLASAGYDTHLVGKWDAGMATPRHTPHGRGYKTSLNYFSHGNWGWSEAEWQGSEDHRKTIPTCTEPDCVTDLWDTDRPATGLNGTVYEEEIFLSRMMKIVDQHEPSQPLFLTYTPKIAHYPLQSPIEYQRKFAFIDEPHRKVYHSMVNYLDDQLKYLTDALKAKGMWNNTLMILSGDNGGYVKPMDGAYLEDGQRGTVCFNGEAGANNYPLKGGKYTPFEGGVRSTSFVSGGFLPPAVRGTELHGMVHIADWYATLCGLAGVDPKDTEAEGAGLPAVDSLDMWPLVSGQTTTSPRREILIDDSALIYNDLKIVTNKQPGASWGGPQYPNTTTAERSIFDVVEDCGGGCVYNVATDPQERNNLAASEPATLQMMQQRLTKASKTIWKRTFPPDDPVCMRTAISRYGGYLGPWLDLQD